MRQIAVFSLAILVSFCASHLFAAQEVQATPVEIAVPLPVKQVNFNPTKLNDQSSLWVSRHVNCQLTRKQQGKVLLEAASSLEYVTARKVKIVLGNRYRFHNGEPITAADVIATFEFLRAHRQSYKAQFDLVDRAYAVDDKTLIFEFKELTAKLFLDFFSTSQNPLLPKSYLRRAAANPNLLDTPVVCGDYKIANYVPGERVVLASAQGSGNNITFFLQGNTRLAAGELEKFDLVPAQLTTLDQNAPEVPSRFREMKLFDPYQIVVGLNTKMEPWTKEENRCRLFGALDPAGPNLDYKPNSAPAADLFPKGVLGFKVESDYPGFYKKATGGAPTLNRPFCVSFVNASIPEARKNAFVAMIKHAYPNTTTKEIVDPAAFGPTFLDQKCDAIVIGFKSNNLDGADFLNVFTEKDVNYTGFWSDELKTHIQRAQTLEDSGRRADEFHAVSQSVRDLCLIDPILTVQFKSVLLRDRLEFPDLGKSVLNEYNLGDVRAKP